MRRDRTTDMTYVSECNTHTRGGSMLELIRATCTTEQYSSAICDALKLICFVLSEISFKRKTAKSKFRQVKNTVLGHLVEKKGQIFLLLKDLFI